jgi:hypothetical protein
MPNGRGGGFYQGAGKKTLEIRLKRITNASGGLQEGEVLSLTSVKCDLVRQTQRFRPHSVRAGSGDRGR